MKIRLHPVFKMILSPLILIVSYTQWNIVRLCSITILCLLLILLDCDKKTLLHVSIATISSVAVYGFNIIIGNPNILALGVGIRVYIMFLLMIFMFRTSVSELLRGLQSCHTPDQIMLGFLVVYRFVIVLRNDMEIIRQARSMIPANKMLPMKRLYRCFLVPFVYRMFSLADTLSLSLENRDFGVTVRSQYSTLRLKTVDFIVLSTSVFVIVGVIWML